MSADRTSGAPIRFEPVHHTRVPVPLHQRRGTFGDWVLVGLSFVAAGLAAWVLWRRPGGAYDALVTVDAVVCAIFALAVWRQWLRVPGGRAYLRRHWWEVPALVPLLLPLDQGWHGGLWLVLVVRVVRLVDRLDNVLGDRITAALVEHFSGPIVDAIKRPITIAVLDEVIDVIQTGTYARNVRLALDENRAELDQMILDLVRADQTAGKIKYVPFHDDILRLVSDSVFRIVHGALEDPRTTELISDIIRNSATQVRQAVREHR